MFADDNSVFIEGTHYEQVISIFNKELEKDDVWLQTNYKLIDSKLNWTDHINHIKIKYINI